MYSSCTCTSSLLDPGRRIFPRTEGRPRGKQCRGGAGEVHMLQVLAVNRTDTSFVRVAKSWKILRNSAEAC